MKFSKSNNIEKYSIKFNNDDEGSFRCMWANIYLDSDNWTLTAVTDCGNFSYCWGYEKGRTFLKFLTQIDKYYLLNKISKSDIFCFDDSKNAILRHIFECRREFDYPKENIRKAYEHVKEIDDCSGEMFYNQLSEFDECEDIFHYEIYEKFVYRYPYGAETFAEIVTGVFRDILIKQISEVQNEKVL